MDFREEIDRKLEQCINFLRYGQAGDYVESLDGSVRVTRLDDFYNTLPWCLIKENGQSRESHGFYSDVVPVLEQMLIKECQTTGGIYFAEGDLT